MSKFRTLIAQNFILSVWVTFSLLCLLSCFVTHSILNKQINNTSLVHLCCIDCKKEKAGDVYGNSSLNPDEPEQIVFTINGKLSCEDFMCLINSDYKGNYRPLVFNMMVNDQTLTFHSDCYVDPKMIEIFEIKAILRKNNDVSFKSVWNNDVDAKNIKIDVAQASLQLKHFDSLFSVTITVGTVGALCFLAVLAGLVIVGLILLMTRGYSMLHPIIKFALWVVFFPVLIFIFGELGGEGNVITGEKIYDTENNVIGFYDSNNKTYRDKNGKLRSPNWWLKK